MPNLTGMDQKHKVILHRQVSYQLGPMGMRELAHTGLQPDR